MGGGGAMRAAAKVAGIGVATGVRSTIPSVPPPAEHSFRSASRPVSVAISSSQTSSHAGVETAGHQRPAWELDDWEFAGAAGEEDPLLFDSSAATEPMPRVVFGAAPSLNEAKAATDDLKDAIERVFLSSPSQNGSNGPLGAGQTPALSLLRSSDHLEASGCTTCLSTASSFPAMRAFTLLNESPAVQSVVASIACDPNVWDAVLNNEALTSFLETRRNNAEIHNTESPRESHILSEDVGSPEEPTKLSDEASTTENSEARPINFLDNIKVAVVEMVTNVSSFVQNLFGVSSAEKVSDSSTDGNAKTGFMDNKTWGASFMALAVMVIMVVVMKRA